MRLWVGRQTAVMHRGHAAGPRLCRATALTQVLEEPLRGRLHQIQHFLKSVRPTVVRVRNLSHRSVRRKLEEQPHPITCVRGGPMVKDAQVLPIHRENEIEVFKITRLNDARA